MAKDEKRRFAFGKNWQDFLQVLSDAHILEAEKALSIFLGTNDLSHKRFLDIGSGSGLHSLAARRMGAVVYSFDYDLQSVECTQKLKDRYFPNEKDWLIQQGSILDEQFIRNLGDFDICYAWGVLHHTGALWQAAYNTQLPLHPGGLLFVAIYNDQGLISATWKLIKKTHNLNWLGRAFIESIFYPIFFLSGLIIDIIHFRNPATRYDEHKKYRGMSLIHDWRDWLGGYPFEPAKPEKVIDFYKNLGFELVCFSPTGHGFGNNQFLFRRINMGT